MTRYTFTERKTLDILPNGKVFIYYDEKEGTETSTYEDEETHEIHTVTYPIWTYRRAETTTPVTKGKVVNAIIREDYPQDAVEAIFRHKLAGTDEGEFDTFNNFAEWAKNEEKRILNEE